MSDIISKLRKLPAGVGLALWSGAAIGLVTTPTNAEGLKLIDLPSPAPFIGNMGAIGFTGATGPNPAYHVLNPYSELGEAFDASQPELRKPDQAQLLPTERWRITRRGWTPV